MGILIAAGIGILAALIVFAAFAAGYRHALHRRQPQLTRLAAYERRRDIEFNQDAPEWLRQTVERARAHTLAVTR